MTEDILQDGSSDWTDQPHGIKERGKTLAARPWRLNLYLKMDVFVKTDLFSDINQAPVLPSYA